VGGQLIHQDPDPDSDSDPVPRPAALVRDFVNTLDHELATDALETCEGLTSFLADHRLLSEGDRAIEGQRAAAISLRSAVHDALKLNHTGARAELPELDSVLGRLSVRLAWDGKGVVAQPAQDGVDGALAGIGLAAQEAMASGVWWRLKVCAFDECEWAYYDQSKNRSRNYCEHGCGNKVKTRAYRARLRSGGPSGHSR
jgi:predicted RNA-binding Zn ribbon-like protein